MHSGEEWAFTRVATASAFTAATYASFPGVKNTTYGTKALCYARAQLGYLVGDTGFSYVVGFGNRFPMQVHHRDSTCTLEEDNAGECACVAPLLFSFPPPFFLFLWLNLW
jgi:hypothetical protein